MTEKPSWSVPSDYILSTINAGVNTSIPLPVTNPAVEYTAAYPPNDVPVEIYIFPSYNNVNTSTPHTNRFVGNTKTFADVNDFWIKSNGLPPTTPATSPYSQYTATSVDYVFRLPRQRNIKDVVNNHIATDGIIGVAIDGVPFVPPNSKKIHRFYEKKYIENDVLNPVNYPTNDGSRLVDADGVFYYNSDPKLLYTKNPSHHSPIIGYALDGWPIYGPYGYSNPLVSTSGISLMTPSYHVSTSLRSNGTNPDGSFIEDYIYIEGSGTLDKYNGRECITPEYPNGVYAYFITVNPYNTDEPIYPYIIGPYFKSRPVKPNGKAVYPGDMALSVISYKLPPGLRISDNNIVGTAYSIKTDTSFRFVIRAENSTGISDKTLIIKVIAQTGLIWETLPGALPVGNNNLFPEPMQFNPNYLGPDLAISNNGLTITARRSNFLNGSTPTVLTNYAIKEGMKVMFSMIASRSPLSRSHTIIGIATHSMDLTTLLGYTNDSAGFSDEGIVYGNEGKVHGSGYPEIENGNIVDIAVDRQNHLMWLRVNGGPWNGNPDQSPVLATGGVDISFIKHDVYPAISPYYSLLFKGQYDIKKLPSYEIPYGFTFVGTDVHGDTYYVLDNAPIKYQLSVVDRNLSLSRDLEFYIPPNGGELPPGITLNSKGLLSGFTKPLFTVITSKFNGNYDMNFYDSGPYDYGITPNNGFDSFFYDTFDYDFSYLVNIPHKLNRYYQFIVRATDGYFFEDRKFKIYVVGDDHLRADTTLMRSGTNFYRADSTYLRKPIWLTPNYLGTKRANNYITIFTSVYTSDSIVGVITYILDRVNDDETPSRLPIGLSLDEQTGVIYGEVPYQPAISKTYKFTIRAYRLDPMKGEMVSTPRTFTMDIIGDIEGTITFTTGGDLGSIDSDMISTLMVKATTKIKRTTLIYSLIAGKLPPGLILFNDGTLQGKVNQFENSSQLGLTTIDMSTTTFDSGTTRVDRQFIFTVKAADQLGLSATTKTFSLLVNTPSKLPYSNIYVKPFLDVDLRIEILAFLNNINVFTPNLIYRPTDPNFGVQHNLKMLLYPGIETVEVGKYVAALGRSRRQKLILGNVKKAIAKLPGTNTVVYEVVYVDVLDRRGKRDEENDSVININDRRHPVNVNQGRRDPIDGYGSNITNVSGLDNYPRISLQDRVMGADFNGQLVNDSNKSTIFRNSISSIIDEIGKVGDTERNYLPLWMRTPQSYSGVMQSFPRAIPICYTIPGGADKILLNIKHSGFDFKSIDCTIDRAIIDSVADYIGDKYLMFPAREVING